MVFTANKPTVSIIIPVYNGGKNFRRCLLSLDQSKTTPDEIVVVSDGDSDGSWRMAKNLTFRF